MLKEQVVWLPLGSGALLQKHGNTLSTEKENLGMKWPELLGEG